MKNIVEVADRSADEAERILAEEVGRLLESPMFMRSPVLSRLLQFLADHRRHGGRAAPKAYAIATEALGRSADFDPAIDSYPRVMVGRLRNLLDRYYAETPSLRRLRVPHGTYEIRVEYRTDPRKVTPNGALDPASTRVDTNSAAARSATSLSLETPVPAPPPPPPAVHRLVGPGWRWVALAIAILLALVFCWRMAHSHHASIRNNFVGMPVVEISDPAADQTGPMRPMARSLDGKLRDGLRRFDLVQLRSSASSRTDISERRAPDYRLDTLLVPSGDGAINVTLVLNHVLDQRAIWSQQVRLTTDDLPEFHGLDSAIAMIAGDYGMIVRDQLQRQPGNYTAGFPCLAQFNRVLHTLDRAMVRRIDECLRASSAEMPQNPVPLSALSLLRFSEWQAARATPHGKSAFVEGKNLAERASAIDPDRSASLFAMARAKYYSGDCQRGTSLGNAALSLNPYDPEIAGFLGLFKASCGDPEEGEILLRRSLVLDASHAGVPAVALAFVMSQRGANSEALALLDSMPSPRNLEPQYLMTRSLIFARMGKMDEAQQLWRRVLKITRRPIDAAPETVVKQFIISPLVVSHTSKALRETGVAGRTNGI